MAASQSQIVNRTDFDPRTGEAIPLAPGLVRLTAPNAGPYTFTGTNTFLIGHDSVAVLDPGPDEDAHLEAILKAAGDRPIEAIVLTHTHRDHSALVPRLRALTGAPLVSGGPHRLSRPLKPFEVNPFARASAFDLTPDRQIADGERLEFGGVALEAVATPGHCANHFAFALTGTDMLLIGDHLMAWNSTVVATPDGSLADYLASLDRVEAQPEKRYLPGHGGEIEDGPARARAMRAHRLMRNGQVLEALGEGPLSLSRLTDRVYPQLAPKVRIGARRTLLSHAEYLEAAGKVRIGRWPWGTRVSLVR